MSRDLQEEVQEIRRLVQVEIDYEDSRAELGRHAKAYEERLHRRNAAQATGEEDPESAEQEAELEVEALRAALQAVEDHRRTSDTFLASCRTVKGIAPRKSKMDEEELALYGTLLDRISDLELDLYYAVRLRKMWTDHLVSITKALAWEPKDTSPLPPRIHVDISCAEPDCSRDRKFFGEDGRGWCKRHAEAAGARPHGKIS